MLKSSSHIQIEKTKFRMEKLDGDKLMPELVIFYLLQLKLYVYVCAYVHAHMNVHMHTQNGLHCL